MGASLRQTQFTSTTSGGTMTMTLPAIPVGQSYRVYTSYFRQKPGASVTAVGCSVAFGTAFGSAAFHHTTQKLSGTVTTDFLSGLINFNNGIDVPGTGSAVTVTYKGALADGDTAGVWTSGYAEAVLVYEVIS